MYNNLFTNNNIMSLHVMVVLDELIKLVTYSMKPSRETTTMEVLL